MHLSLGVALERCHAVLGPILGLDGVVLHLWKFLCWLLHKTMATESSHRMMEGRGAALMIPMILYASEWHPWRFWVDIIGVWSLHVERYRWTTMQGCRPIDSVLWRCRANPAQSTDTPDRRGNSSDVWSRWVGNIPLYSTVEGISAWAIIVGFFTCCCSRHECSQKPTVNSVGASNWNSLD